MTMIDVEFSKRWSDSDHDSYNMIVRPNKCESCARCVGYIYSCTVAGGDRDWYTSAKLTERLGLTDPLRHKDRRGLQNWLLKIIKSRVESVSYTPDPEGDETVLVAGKLAGHVFQNGSGICGCEHLAEHCDDDSMTERVADHDALTQRIVIAMLFANE